MLQFSLWQKILIWSVCALGILFALPNAFYTRVEIKNDIAEALSKGLQISSDDITNSKKWPSFLPSNLVNLGLDLRGGAHLLAEVKVEDVYAQRLDAMWQEVRDILRAERNDIGTIRRQGGRDDQLRVKISKIAGMDKAISAVETLARPVASLSGVGSKDIEVSSDQEILIIEFSEAEKLALNTRTMEQSLEIIRRRVDEVGTREPTIQKQGERRILIQVPGIGSASELKTLIGTTAKLGFYKVIRQTSNANELGNARTQTLPARDEEGVFYVLDKTAVVTGEELVDAQPSFNQNGQPSVSFRFNPGGARKFGNYTSDNVGSLFAIVLDNEVISAPQIREAITGGSGQITGNFSVQESSDLSILLRAGALPAPMRFEEERTIGPELGQDSIDAGKIACMIAFAAILIFMFLSYGLFGLFANIALIINVSLLFGLLSIIGATLTLPGIAGIVLTVGMAVDANVLIFERIKEELKVAKTPYRAIELGYERAFSAILDANITTFIAALILFLMGSGPVRGFSITLGLGIITSVFTAIYVTRLLIAVWFDWQRPKKIIV
ncbi:MAG: protein translocase subunit SecD [Rhodobacteraceae bacterium]|jgi:preprotein translocase subunit SecD|nr:protein translocase subunit SecD [Paracoccaceae bacterium]|tara:strand:- start:14746 stop:16410 length:1665 start_codon:yes stop_codon:yes gene_type:complete